MFDLFNFELLQLRYVKAAMDTLASFRPDGKTPAEAQAMIDTARAARTTYGTRKAEMDLARGEFIESVDAGHVVCIQVYPIMVSRFRNDAGSLSAIKKLPVADQTPAQTIDRMKDISTLWGKLPNPPGSATPFKAWETMDKAAFDAYLTAIIGSPGPPVILGTQAAVPLADQAFELAEGELNRQKGVMEEFTTAALIQGRAQYRPGTPERDVIDAIPMEPSQQAPGKAVISAATSPGAGQAHLEFDAPHSTSWDVYRKGPGEADFAKVADDIITKFYDATGLAAGAHDFKVVGRNSKGDGPESDVSTVNVG
jgi:hypothetical protein